MSKTIKMTYIPAQFRVRLEFSKEDTLASAHPPQDILERAKNKLRREKEKGLISFYQIETDRLQAIWDSLRASVEPLNTRLAMTIVTGTPAMPGLILTKSEDDEALAYLSVSSFDHLNEAWGYKPFKVSVNHFLSKMGIMKKADPAHLHAAWVRLCRGERIKAYPIFPMLSLPNHITHHYQIIHKPDYGEVQLIVYNIRSILDHELIVPIIEQISSESKTLSVQHKQSYQVFKADIVRELRSANRGPERFGLDLPAIYLASLSRSALSKSNSRVLASKVIFQEIPSQSQNFQEANLASLVKIKVSPDKMKAYIESFQKEIFQLKEAFNPKHWINFLHSHNITFGIKEERLNELVTKVKEGGDLNNLSLAEGLAPVPASEVYLYETYKFPKQNSGSAVSLRENQQRKIVRKGQVIAEFMFRYSAKIGYNIFGHELQAAPLSSSMLPSLTLGEGVSQDGGRFLANIDGSPEISETEIKIHKIQLIEGSVNLASGNIHCDGPLEITGSIEEGAVVKVHGDLNVLGMISGGWVQVSGSIKVQGGILTGKHGSIKAKGDITADYLENSTLTCDGSLTITKNIVTSKVWVGKQILVQSSGSAIIGGTITCKDQLFCCNLGRKDGSLTSVRVGVDWQAERKVKTLQQHLKSLNKILGEQEGELKFYKQKRPAQMTERHHESLSKLQQKHAHCQELIIKVQSRIEQASQKNLFNLQAQIIIKETLSSNCSIEIAGTKVHNVSDVASVDITFQKKQGAVVAPLSGSK